MKIIIACGGAIIKDYKLLLTKRVGSKKRYPFCWTFPSGKLEESDKNLESTAIREVKEEVNLDFRPSRKLGYYETNTEEEIIIGFIFLGEWSGDLKAQESEISEIGWFSYQETKEIKLAFSYNETIEDLYKAGLIK